MSERDQRCKTLCFEREQGVAHKLHPRSRTKLPNPDSSVPEGVEQGSHSGPSVRRTRGEDRQLSSLSGFLAFGDGSIEQRYVRTPTADELGDAINAIDADGAHLRPEGVFRQVVHHPLVVRD
jgi:hypothetical protein